jgi:glycosyltransferase involved in cell wall biosynthesis
VKVAMVGPYPLPGRPPTGGVEAVAVALVRGLRAAGVDPTLVTCTSAVSAPDVVRDDGLDLHLLPYGSSARRTLPYITEQRHVKRTLRRLGPDVVHVQGQTHVATAALSVGLPTVVTLHGIIYREQYIADPTAGAARRIRARLRNGLNARFERTVLRRARDLVIISPYVLDAVKDMTVARTHMVANPIDDDFYEIPRRPVPGRVLFVGVMSPRKNVMVLVRAFEEVLRRRPDATLHLVGRPADPGYLQALKDEIARRGMSGSVRHLGVVSDEELRHEYGEATILALPSKEESSPMAIQQAMAMGLPIVASRAAGIPFLVEEGVTGLLATPDDEADLAGQLVTALDDDALRGRMADACRATAERFRADAVARATLDVYAQAAGVAAPVPAAR